MNTMYTSQWSNYPPEKNLAACGFLLPIDVASEHALCVEEDIRICNYFQTEMLNYM